MLKQLYDLLPESIQPYARDPYTALHPNRISSRELRRQRSQFVTDFFGSRTEYREFVAELDVPPVSRHLSEAEARVERVRGTAGLSNTYYFDVYAYVRKTRPDVIVETGVRDGWSTLYILAGLHQNDHGRLYSIDLPIREDENLNQFVRDAPSYDGEAPTIPTDMEPGWIVPDELQSRWNLMLGKSQAMLPALVERIDHMDVFVHDSDHSLTCMIFEYELSWEWLVPGGMIFSDDVHWNDAFDEFVRSKRCDHGHLSRSFGYVRKPRNG